MFDRDDRRTCEINDGPTNESDEARYDESRLKAAPTIRPHGSSRYVFVPVCPDRNCSKTIRASSTP